MRTVRYQDVMDGIAGLLMIDRRQDRDPATAEIWTLRMNSWVRKGWDYWPFKEFQITEQRAFRQVWNADDIFTAETEIYYPDGDAYYTVAADTDPGDTPVSAPAKFAALELTDRYLAFDQAGKQSIGEVIGIYDSDPRLDAGRPWNYPFALTDEGIKLSDALAAANTIWITYKVRQPVFTSIPYDATRLYRRDALVFDALLPDIDTVTPRIDGTGECYRALEDGTGQELTDQRLWMKQEFPYSLSEYVQSGVASELVDDLETRQIHAGTAEAAIVREIDKEREQGVHNRYRLFPRRRRSFGFAFAAIISAFQLLSLSAFPQAPLASPVDRFGNPRTPQPGGHDTILHGRLSDDLDANGKKILNLDVSGLPIERVYRPESYGAKGDMQQLTNASISSSSRVLSSASAPFHSSDAGKKIVVPGAGPSGAPLITTVQAYTSSGSVTLASAASTTASNSFAYWGTDDTVAFQAMLDDIAANKGGHIALGHRQYGIGATLRQSASQVLWSGTSLGFNDELGDGRGAQGSTLMALGTGISIIKVKPISSERPFNIKFENVALRGAGVADGNIGLDFEKLTGTWSSAAVTCENVSVTQLQTGINAEDIDYFIFTGGSLAGECDTGINLVRGVYPQIGGGHSMVADNKTYGVRGTNVYGLQLVGLQAIRNAGSNVSLEGCRNFVVTASSFETSGGFYGATPVGLNIDQAGQSTSLTGSICEEGVVTGNTFFAPTLGDSASYSIAAMRVSGGSSGMSIVGNHFGLAPKGLWVVNGSYLTILGNDFHGGSTQQIQIDGGANNVVGPNVMDRAKVTVATGTNVSAKTHGEIEVFSSEPDAVVSLRNLHAGGKWWTASSNSTAGELIFFNQTDGQAGPHFLPTGGITAPGPIVGGSESLVYAATVTPTLVENTDIGTLTGNVTIANISGTKINGQKKQIHVVQDASGGRTVNLGTDYILCDGVAFSTTASKHSYVMFQWETAASLNKWVGKAVVTR